MTQPFVGQLQAFGFNYAPKNWLQCNGQLLPINQYAALFSLLGTTYGGNGITTFQLPNLQSRVPMHMGKSLTGATYVQGEVAGEENVGLNVTTMPSHTHGFFGSSANATRSAPAAGTGLGKIYAGTTPDNFYGPDSPLQPLNPQSVSMAGSGVPHANIQPYLAINWCIAIYGIFPSRN